MKVLTTPRLAGVVAVALALVLVVYPRSGQADQEKAYVGTQTCLACHTSQTPALVTGMQHSLHGTALLDEKLPQDKQGCESCHGPGGDHLAHLPEPGTSGITDALPDPLRVFQNTPTSMPDADHSWIVNPRKLPAAQANAVCLKCHLSGEEGQNWHMGKHSQEGLSCLTCHDPHRAADQPHLLLKPTSTALCLTCHQEQRHKFSLTSHHPVLEGRMSCVDCHNPHGSGNSVMLVKEQGATCLTCHSNYAGPFAVEHVPAVGVGLNSGCLDCHQPHGSPNRRLLTLTDRGTCLQCHANKVTHNPGNTCLACHSFVHGSNTNSTVPFSQP